MSKLIIERIYSDSDAAEEDIVNALLWLLDKFSGEEAKSA